MTRIRRLLVANRGEIARRVFRTARSMGIETVAVYSDADEDAAHVRDADIAVRLGSADAAQSYLSIERIMAAVEAAGADAVHPGYGFLAENADFARTVTEAGAVFVGPSPDAIAAMGDKSTARARMETAGVPILPGGPVSPDRPGDAVAVATALGFPVLIKAVAGGGGRGMRVVATPADLAETLIATSREAAASFGDGRIYLERFLGRARHVEVQVFGDSHGRVIHLYERECSIQRRHQKLIEESPSPSISDTVRAALWTAAVEAAAAIDYENAGTVEFLVDEDERFYFLEMNTRLQVEHPVTEAVTGLDLVALQLDVAAGGHLPPQEDIPSSRGHAIEARLYAEDPTRMDLPTTGVMHRFRFPGDIPLRIDTGIREGSSIAAHYDPLLAKIVSHAEDRSGAIRVLEQGLARAVIHGPATNRALLRGVLLHPAFFDAAIDTGFLEKHRSESLELAAPSRDHRAVGAAAVALARQASRRSAAPVLRSLPSGWRNVGSVPQRERFVTDDGVVAVEYRLARTGWEVAVDDEQLDGLVVHSAGHEEVDLTVRGIRHRLHVDELEEATWVDGPGFCLRFLPEPRFPVGAPVAASPGSLTSPVPGKVVAVAASPGDEIAAGTAIVTVESMKMEHAVTLPVNCTVEQILVALGDQVAAGDVLVVISVDRADGR